MPSFGDTLKRERELRQISLREISETTKINLRYLEALERNEFRHLPGGVFNKGFVRAYAQYIGIDADAMVDAYLDEVRSQEEKIQERGQDHVPRPAPRPKVAAPPVPEAPRQTRGRGIWPLVAAAIAVMAVVVITIVAVQRFRARHAPPGGVPAESSAGELRGNAGGTDTSAGAPGAPETGGGSAAQEPPGGPASPGAVAPAAVPFAAKVLVDRPMGGSLVCDGAVVRNLREMSAGVPIEVTCRELVLLDAEDGGAVRVGLGGAEPEPAGAPGALLRERRYPAPKREPGAAEGARP